MYILESVKHPILVSHVCLETTVSQFAFNVNGCELKACGSLILPLMQLPLIFTGFQQGWCYSVVWLL